MFERWDGSGFPDGLAGGQIPLPARFAQLSYDAMLVHEHRHGVGQITGPGPATTRTSPRCCTT